MSNFTKNIWNVSSSKNMNTGVVTHTINNGTIPFDESVSNAYLFAESPVMYEMLDGLRAFLNEDGLTTDGLAAELSKIPDILAKARGAEC